MALRFRLRSPAWGALCGLLAVGALLGYAEADSRWDWQPALALQQPWRAWSAVFVHWSAKHLTANLLGTLLLATLGWAAACGQRAALAWLLAWPLTQLGLLLQPDLRHYGGLSGVLHAGVAVAAWHLLFEHRRRARLVGASLLAGLCVKLLLESPWDDPLRQAPGWDIAIAPLAHATGAFAGLACGVALLGRRRPAAAP